jgi:hypothetical protein
MALGVTMQLPVEDKHNYTREYLNDQIAILLGGRIAEEITMNGMTTGAGNDLERSTELARKMVCEWGMSDAMGPLTFGKKEEQIFLGREIAQHQDYSEDTALKIDAEVKRIISDNYNRATALLSEHKQQLVAIADALLAREVLDADQVRRLSFGQPLEELATPEAPAPPAAGDAARDRSREKERTPLVAPLPDRSHAGIGGVIAPRGQFLIPLPGRPPLELGRRALVMGVLNLTPDSFSADGLVADPARALDAVRAMEEAGADIIDIGAESTRPGAAPVSAAEEIARLRPVLRAVGGRVRVPCPSTPARPRSPTALDEGVAIVNDVSRLDFTTHGPLVAARGCHRR